MDKKCSIKNCNTPHYNVKRSKDGCLYCSKHYQQINKHGKIKERTIYDSNEIILYDNYAEIILYNKECKEIARTQIDLEDVERCREYKWSLTKKADDRVYVKAVINSKFTYLHRFLLDCEDDIFVVDHCNHNTLDNKKSNLRICSNQENSFNSSLNINSKSTITGVWWDNRRDKWVSFITIDGNRLYLGGYKNIKYAIITRLLAEKKYFKDFAPQKHLYEEYINNIDLTLEEYILKLKKEEAVLGVYFNITRGKWIGYLNIGKKKYSKEYDTKEGAIKGRLEIEKEHFGSNAPQYYLFDIYDIQ